MFVMFCLELLNNGVRSYCQGVGSEEKLCVFFTFVISEKLRHGILDD